MEGILIAFSLPTGQNKTRSSAFTKALYGQETSSHSGKYRYRRRGLLDNILYNKLIRGVIIVRSEDAKIVTAFLEKHSARFSIRNVRLEKEDCEVLNLASE